MDDDLITFFLNMAYQDTNVYRNIIGKLSGLTALHKMPLHRIT